MVNMSVVCAVTQYDMISVFKQLPLNVIESCQHERARVQMFLIVPALLRNVLFRLFWFFSVVIGYK